MSVGPVDLVVVGTGVAGLSAVRAARARGLRVAVVTKDEPDAGSTRWAQGGIAVADPATGDSVAAHLADTVAAGGGLVDRAVARDLLGAAPSALAQLRAAGAGFDADGNGRLRRGREGGHGAARVLHAGGDATGAEVQRALTGALDPDGPGPAPLLLAGHTAVDVLTNHGRVTGLAVLDADGRPRVVPAPAVLLATGGVGGLFTTTTTNPPVATADGWALALRAGAELADVEFVQFHPTALATRTSGRAPLVTEALRGAGARLVDRSGRPVVDDPRGDLAPRDVVAAAITARIAAEGSDAVRLDARAVPEVTSRFPTVTRLCAAIGVDVRTDLVPVRPAAHYACGGVVTDAHGRTGVPGLWAAGEVARTGLHGANRLASNSLLEGLVVGRRAGEGIATAVGGPHRTPDPVAPEGAARPAVPRDTLRAAMTGAAGLGRCAAGLAAASDALEAAAAPVAPTDRWAVEDAGLTLAAAALLAAAGTRTETRGCHVRTDFPGRDDRGQAGSIAVGLDGDGRLRVRDLAAARGGAA